LDRRSDRTHPVKAQLDGVTAFANNHHRAAATGKGPADRTRRPAMQRRRELPAVSGTRRQAPAHPGHQGGWHVRRFRQGATAIRPIVNGRQALVKRVGYRTSVGAHGGIAPRHGGPPEGHGGVHTVDGMGSRGRAGRGSPGEALALEFRDESSSQGHSSSPIPEKPRKTRTTADAGGRSGRRTGLLLRS